MCGLAGFLNVGKGFDFSRAVRMADTLRHRGPDQKGFWVDYEQGVALAHRRLSILDLSSTGNQPMTSTEGRYVLVFNGEIYNHMEMRQALAKKSLAPIWKGHSDTETLLAAISAWGIS